jgi:hypothetical protein
MSKAVHGWLAEVAVPLLMHSWQLNPHSSLCDISRGKGAGLSLMSSYAASQSVLCPARLFWLISATGDGSSVPHWNALDWYNSLSWSEADFDVHNSKQNRGAMRNRRAPK